MLRSARSFLTLALALVLSPALAFASVSSSCKLLDGTMTVQMELAHGTPTSRLLVDGKEIPAVGAGCQADLGRAWLVGGGWRCPHSDGSMRYEIYPIFRAQDGKATTVRVIRWLGSQPGPVLESRDCE